MHSCPRVSVGMHPLLEKPNYWTVFPTPGCPYVIALFHTLLWIARVPCYTSLQNSRRCARPHYNRYTLPETPTRITFFEIATSTAIYPGIQKLTSRDRVPLRNGGLGADAGNSVQRRKRPQGRQQCAWRGGVSVGEVISGPAKD